MAGDDQPSAAPKDELLARLRTLEADRARAGSVDRERLIHELQVHQLELERQNRELREAQAALEESRARYADLYDLAPIGYVTLDRHGVVRQANLTASVMFGLERQRLLERPLVSSIDLADRKTFLAHVKACFDGSAPVSTELTFTPRGRAPVVVQLVSTPIAGGARRAVECRTAITDISALKRSEERLRLLARAGELLGETFDYEAAFGALVRLLVPLVADAAFGDLVDDDGRVRRVAAAFADQRKHAAADRERGRAVDGTLPQAEVLRTARPVLIAELPRTGDAQLVEEPPPELRGARSLAIAPLVARGRALGALTVVAAESGRRYTPADLELLMDLASRAAIAVDNARLYQAARRAIRAREEVLAVVSHDLRNPLHGIRLNAEAMLRERRPDDARQLHSILRGTENMNAMIGDLLDLSNIDAGRLSIVPDEHEARELVTSAVDAMAPLARERGLTLTAEPPPEARVRGDRRRVLQVFANLIGNAIKFTPEGGTIRVSSALDGGALRFSVADDGPGIAREQLAHLCERHWRGCATVKGGSGLGLHIVKGIVEAHGGTLRAESRPGHGASFHFTLPLAAQGRAREPAPAHDARESAACAGFTVLVVDDNREARDAVRHVLLAEGHRVLEACDGREALRVLRREACPPGLVLLDLKMAGTDGWTLHAELKRDPALASIPVVLLSAGERVADEARALGAAGFIRKPVGIADLLAAVERHVAR